jgi:hypothetical protein
MTLALSALIGNRAATTALALASLDLPLAALSGNAAAVTTFLCVFAVCLWHIFKFVR